MEKEIKKTKYELLIENIDAVKLEKWKAEQNDLKSKLVEVDDLSFDINNQDNIKIAGVDISASKINPNKAIVGFCVINSKDFSILYEDYDLVEMTEPYVPGYLAFREVEHLINLINKLKNKDFMPDVILVDGNGILHSNKFGLACHLGVRLNIPTIGCGKTIFSVDGITSKSVKELTNTNLLKGGDFVYLKGTSEAIWGAALRSTDKACSPIFISIGNKVTIDTALKILNISINYRVPEPIRITDLTTRLLLKHYESLNFKEFNITEYLKKETRNFISNKEII